jgi:mannosyltransferase
MKNRQRFMLEFIILLAAVLRCLFLNSREIYYDDAFSIFLSNRSLAEIISGTAADTMPPLYYFLLHAWQKLGAAQLWQLRFLNVGLSLLVVFGVFLVVCKLATEKAALWAAFFTAISPFQIYHAQEIRMYVILELNLLGYFLSFLEFYQPGKIINKIPPQIGFIIFGALAMYSHNLAIFSIVVINIFLLIKQEWKQLLRVFFLQFFIGILALPWLWFVPQQISKIQTAFWTPRPGLVEVIQALVQSTASLPLSGIWMTAAVVLSVQIFVITILETFRQEKNDYWIQLLVISATTPPLLMFLTSFFMRPVFVARGFIFSFLAFYMIIAIVMTKSNQKILILLLGGAMITSAAISLPQQYTFNGFPRSPFREVANYLAEHHDSLILHDNKLSFFPCHFYNPALPQSFLPDEPGSHNDTYAVSSQQAMDIFPAKNLESVTDGAASIQFVVFERAIQEYQKAGKHNHPVLETLEKNYQLMGIARFHDLLIYQFKLPDES